MTYKSFESFTQLIFFKNTECKNCIEQKNVNKQNWTGTILNISEMYNRPAS